MFKIVIKTSSTIHIVQWEIFPKISFEQKTEILGENPSNRLNVTEFFWSYKLSRLIKESSERNVCTKFEDNQQSKLCPV